MPCPTGSVQIVTHRQQNRSFFLSVREPSQYQFSHLHHHWWQFSQIPRKGIELLRRAMTLFLWQSRSHSSEGFRSESSRSADSRRLSSSGRIQHHHSLCSPQGPSLPL